MMVTRFEAIQEGRRGIESMFWEETYKLERERREELEAEVVTLTKTAEEFLEQRDQARAEIEREQTSRMLAEAERDVFNSCIEEQDRGSGPCGVCRDCLKDEIGRLKRAIDLALPCFEQHCFGYAREILEEVRDRNTSRGAETEGILSKEETS